jgi:hypothetical protein
VYPSGICVASAAAAYDTAVPREPPFAHTQLPDAPERADAMLAVLIDEFVFNSIGAAIVQAGDVALTVTDSELPASSPLRLNTSSFMVLPASFLRFHFYSVAPLPHAHARNPLTNLRQGLLPDLYAKYPNQLMQVFVSAPQQPLPQFTVSTAGVAAVLPATANVSVVAPSGALVPVFTLSITLQANGSVALSASRVGGSLSYLQCAIGLLWSDVTVNPAALQGLINFLAARVIIPQVNVLLAAGFPLPVVEGVSLVNAAVSYGAGFVQIDTDFDYAGGWPW